MLLQFKNKNLNVYIHVIRVLNATILWIRRKKLKELNSLNSDLCYDL